MNLATIAGLLGAKSPGQIFSLTIERNGHTRHGCPVTITKVTHMQGQRCDYADRAPVKAALAAGTREPLELPKYIAESISVDGVRFLRGYNGKTYLPVVVFGSNLKTQWFVDGKPVDKDSIRHYLLSDELRPREPQAEGTVPFITVNIDKVTAIR